MRGHFNSTFLADSVTALVPFLNSNKARFFNQSDCSLYVNFNVSFVYARTSALCYVTAGKLINPTFVLIDFQMTCRERNLACREQFLRHRQPYKIAHY